jgi:hypothetical protein
MPAVPSVLLLAAAAGVRRTRVVGDKGTLDMHAPASAFREADLGDEDALLKLETT